MISGSGTEEDEADEDHANTENGREELAEGLTEAHPRFSTR